MGKPPPILLGLCMKSSASSQRAFHYLHAECWSILDHANRAQISALELCTATCETGFYLSEQCYRLEAGPVGKALRRHLRSPRMPRLIRAVHRVMVLISRTKEGKRTFVAAKIYGFSLPANKGKISGNIRPLMHMCSGVSHPSSCQTVASQDQLSLHFPSRPRVISLGEKSH